MAAEGGNGSDERDGREAVENGADGATEETEVTAGNGGVGLAGAGRSRLRAAAQAWVPEADGVDGNARESAGTVGEGTRRNRKRGRKSGRAKKQTQAELREREEGNDT